ncbi:GH-E family nuclease [Actinoallomurus oryzae]|uniref:GH-E family nuclease n=1 Tax=Actinoallomurus oryzae TaxID=502180 RepID=UPI0031E540FE
MASGHGIAEASNTLATATDTLCSQLADAGACWGSSKDEIGRMFFNGDDKTPGFGKSRDAFLNDLADMVNLLRATGGLLKLSGRNYAVADEASTVGSALPKGADKDALAAVNPYYLPPVSQTLVKSDPVPPFQLFDFLSKLLQELVGGCQWPDGSLSGLASMRDAFYATADSISSVADEVAGHAHTVTANNSGETAQKFASFAAALRGGGEEGGLLWLASESKALGDSVDALIKQEKAARLQFKLSFEFMAATWVAAWVISWFTGPAAEGAALAATESAGSELNAFIRAAAKAALMGAGYGGSLDAIGQYAHIHEGAQKGWNFAELGKAMGEGAIAGGVMGVGGAAVARGSGRLTTALSSWMESGGLKGAASRFAFAGTTGTVGNIVAQAIVDQHVDVGQAAQFGFGMAGIEAARPSGRHSAEQISNAYRLHTWASEHADSLPPAGSAHDGAPTSGTSPHTPPPAGEGGEGGNPAPQPNPGGNTPHNDPSGSGAPPAARAGDSQLASAPAQNAAHTGADAVTAPHGTDNAAAKNSTTAAGPAGEAPSIIAAPGRHAGDATAGAAGDATAGAAGPARQSAPPSNRPSITDILNREPSTSSPRGGAAADPLTGPRSAGGRPPEVPAEPGGADVGHDASSRRDPQPGRPGEALSAAHPDQSHGPQAPGRSLGTATTDVASAQDSGRGTAQPAGQRPEPVPAAVTPVDHGPGPSASHADITGGDHAVSSGGRQDTAVATPADHPAASGPSPEARTVVDRPTPREVNGTRSTDLNPDTRPPLIPAHGERALAALRGEHANTLTEGEALRASQWAHLRDSATAAPVARERYPFENASTVEARRLGLTAPDGTERTVTEFTVKVRLQADEAMAPHDVVRAKSNILDAVDLYYNHQHRLPDGSQLHVRVVFDDVPSRSAADGAVQLHPGNGAYEGERPDMLTWYADMDPVVTAHELGHHFDLHDEYAEPGRLTASEVRRDASAMGSGELYWSDHALVVDHNGNSVPGIVGLRDRHLAELNAFADRAAPDGPSIHGDAGLPVPAEHSTRPGRSDRALDLPDHVRELRDRVDGDGRPVFPAEGRDPVEHAMLLDRMHTLFGDEARTADHLRYTEALSDAARRLYETAPDYSFRGEDLQGLHHLADIADTSPHGRLPHADVLHEVARQTLDRSPTPHDIEGLSKLAAHLNDHMDGRHAFERPSDALHRAAADKLGTLPSTEVTHRAIDQMAEEQRRDSDRHEHAVPAADRKEKAKQKAVRDAQNMRGRPLTSAEQRDIEQAVEQQWRDSGGTLHRPSLRDKTIRGILENRDSQGNLLDANTGKPIPQGRADIGHKPGDEWRRVRDEAKRMGLTQEQLNSIVQDSSMYQWEDRNQNRGHRHEDRSAGGTSKRLQRVKKHRDGSVTIDGQRIYADGSTYDEKTGVKIHSSDVPDVFARRQWQDTVQNASDQTSQEKRALQAQKKADDLTKRIAGQWGKSAKEQMRKRAEQAQADADRLREQAQKKKRR